MLKHPCQVIRKGNGQLQEIAMISSKKYLRFRDLRFFFVSSRENSVFVAQRRLEVIGKVLHSLHSIYCYCFQSTFGDSLSESEFFFKFSTRFQSLELLFRIILDHFLARLREYFTSISSSHKCSKTI